MKAAGHRRPLGTTTRVRMEDCEPTLGDITREQHTVRYYVVVGIEEHRDSPKVWWLTLERISEAQALEKLQYPNQGIWEHIRYRR